MAKKRATLPNDFGAVMERNNLDELRAVFEKCNINAYERTISKRLPFANTLFRLNLSNGCYNTARTSKRQTVTAEPRCTGTHRCGNPKKSGYCCNTVQMCTSEIFTATPRCTKPILRKLSDCCWRTARMPVRKTSGGRHRCWLCYKIAKTTALPKQPNLWKSICNTV